MYLSFFVYCVRQNNSDGLQSCNRGIDFIELDASFCWKPLSTICALHLEISPFDLNFRLNTHFPSIGFFLDLLINSRVLFFLISLSSSFMAVNQFESFITWSKLIGFYSSIITASSMRSLYALISWYGNLSYLAILVGLVLVLVDLLTFCSSGSLFRLVVTLVCWYSYSSTVETVSYMCRTNSWVQFHPLLSSTRTSLLITSLSSLRKYNLYALVKW